MKKWKLTLVLLLVAVLVMPITAYAEVPVQVMVNGFILNSDVPPQIIDGRVMVPLRVVAEALNAGVNWDEATSTVAISTPPQPQIPTLAEEVINLWGNATATPPDIIGGPDDFRQTITQALNLLHEKLPMEYRVVCTFLKSVQWDPQLKADASITQGGLDGVCHIGSDIYNQAKTHLSRDDLVKFYAAALAHEAGHIQLWRSGLAATLSLDDQEVVCYLKNYRIEKQLGLSSSWTTSALNLVKQNIKP